MASRKDSHGIVLQKGEYERKGQRGYMYKWRDAYGVQCSISAVTLQELREKEKDVKIGQLEGRISSQQRKTVNDFYNIWLKQKKRTNIKPNVLSNYIYMYERFVSKSFIGKSAISKVKTSDVKEFYGQLLDNGLALSTVDSGINTVLRQVFAVAYKDDLIKRNPCDEVIKDMNVHAEYESPRALTPEEQQRFLEVIEGTIWEPIFGFLLRTGLRVAEFTALCWSDIDTEKGVIRVQRNFVYYREHGKVKGEKKMERRIQAVKYKSSNRVLPMSADIERYLELWKQIGNENTDVVQSDKGPVSGFIFATRDGMCHNQGTLNRALKRIVKEANSKDGVVLLPNMHCHMLRKTYVSNLCRSGVPLVVASRLAGHKSVAVTAEIYTDVQIDMAQSSDAQLQAYLDSEKSKLNSEQKSDSTQ